MQPGLQPVREKYPILARDLLRPILELLVAAREAGGGDLCFTPEAFRRLVGVREAIIQLAAKSHRLLSTALDG